MNYCDMVVSIEKHFHSSGKLKAPLIAIPYLEIRRNQNWWLNKLMIVFILSLIAIAAAVWKVRGLLEGQGLAARFWQQLGVN